MPVPDRAYNGFGSEHPLPKRKDIYYDVNALQQCELSAALRDY